MLDYDEFPLTPPDTVYTARADNYHRVVASPSIQLARGRLRRSFEETEAVNRVDSVMATRSRFQARTGGSESVTYCDGPMNDCPVKKRFWTFVICGEI